MNSKQVLNKLYGWFLFPQGYLWDWLVAGILILISFVVPLVAIRPYVRFYVPTDPTLSYPMTVGTISGTVLYILTFIWPGSVFVVMALYKRSWHDG